MKTFAPTASLPLLKARATILEATRAFFKEREVLEVDTPILGLAPVTDPYLSALKTRIAHFKDQDFYLQTSPEYYLKRLIATYPISVYQLGKVFRDDEYGAHHSPEFTLLEWYRVGFDDKALMDEMTDLLNVLCTAVIPASAKIQAERLSYRQIFEEYVGCNPHQVTESQLQTLVQLHIGDIVGLPHPNRDTSLQLLMSQVIEPALAKHNAPVFIYHFPKSQAALARLKIDEQGEEVAGRFELYWKGLELANGYDELMDPILQAQRFKADLAQRAAEHLPTVPIDQKLLSALEIGLPACAGVALGFDRLLMILTEASHIKEVQTFYAF